MPLRHNDHCYRQGQRLVGIVVSFCWVVLLTGCRPPTPGSSGGAAHSFAQALAEAQKAGMPVTAQALQKPLPPPEQNAAPLYTRLTELLKTHPISKEDKIVERLASRTLPSEEQFERARRALKHRSDLLPLLHKAVARPQCIFVRDWSRPTYVPMFEIATMRRATRLLTAESLLLAHDGKPLEAVRNQALGFQVARHANAENHLNGYLNSIAFDRITLVGLQNILTLSGTDPAVAEAVRAAVEKHWTLPSLSKALQFQAGSDMVMLEYLRKKGPVSFKGVLSDPSLPPLNPQEWSPERWNLFIDVNGSLLLKHARKLIAVADLPYRESAPVFRTVHTEFDQDKDPQHLLTLIFFSYPQDGEQRAHMQATAEITRAGAAALAWKAKHGRFPPTLEAAMSPVPLDPFDGKPLRYRLEGKGFVVYSIGATGTFAGGTPDQSPDKEALFRYPLPSYSKGPIKEY
jgi:hypothetical protein